MSYDKGDHVEVSIPDPSDLDHRLHRYKGEIVDILEDDLSGITGEPEDSVCDSCENVQFSLAGIENLSVCCPHSDDKGLNEAQGNFSDFFDQQNTHVLVG